MTTKNGLPSTSRTLFIYGDDEPQRTTLTGRWDRSQLEHDKRHVMLLYQLISTHIYICKETIHKTSTHWYHVVCVNRKRS